MAVHTAMSIAKLRRFNRNAIGLGSRSMRLCVRLVIIATVACSPFCNAQTIIPTHTEQLDDTASRAVRGMRYDPVDHPLRWLSDSALIVSHVEHYSYADVGRTTCDGSGIFLVSATGRGSVKTVATNRAVCDAIMGNGVTVDPSGHWIVYSVHVLPNNSRLVRLGFDVGRPDTLQTGCAVYHEYPSLSPNGR
jgi:hypothetical protein